MEYAITAVASSDGMRRAECTVSPTNPRTSICPPAHKQASAHASGNQVLHGERHHVIAISAADERPVPPSGHSHVHVPGYYSLLKKSEDA
jgi:hypothetical protein